MSTLTNSDLFVVQRPAGANAGTYKLRWEDVLSNINAQGGSSFKGVADFTDANVDPAPDRVNGDQYINSTAGTFGWSNPSEADIEVAEGDSCYWSADDNVWYVINSGGDGNGAISSVDATAPLLMADGATTGDVVVESRAASTTESGHVAKLATADDITSGNTTAVVTADLLKDANDASDLQAVTDRGSVTTNGAEFGGKVISGGDAMEGANDGTTLLGGSGISASWQLANGYIYRGYTTGNSTPTFSVKAGGSAFFAADATINGHTVGQGGGDQGSNLAVGANTLNANIGGTSNVAVGMNTLKLNESGINNSGFGYAALENNVSGDYNMGVGIFALRNNVSGNNNIGIGASALQNSTGSNNVGVGYFAGRYIEGSNNTIIGGYTGTEADASLSNTVIISAGTTERARCDSNGDWQFGGKVTSASTEAGDDDDTLVTKDYVDTTAAGASYWDRSGGVLSPGTIEDDVRIGTAPSDVASGFQTLSDLIDILSPEERELYQDDIYALNLTHPFVSIAALAGVSNAFKLTLERITNLGAINLNSDGSASFAGNVKSNSFFNSTRSQASDGCFSGNLGATQTSKISANGSATFAGNVILAGAYTDKVFTQTTSNSSKLELGTRNAVGTEATALTLESGSASFAGSVDARVYQADSPNADDSKTFRSKNTSGAETFSVRANGLASFADDVLSGGTFIADRTGSQAVFYGRQSGSNTSSIFADGSASFASGYSGFTASGTAYATRSNGDNDVWNSGINGEDSSIIMKAGGNASFAGTITAGGYDFDGLDPLP